MRLVALALLLVVVPAQGSAQERTYRLGELAANDISLGITRAETLPELARLGFREGLNLVIDERAGDAAALSRHIREIVTAKPDAVIAIGPEAIEAAASATKTIPIVAFGANPVQMGFAASLARPGGNVTGVSILFEELEGKRAALLHEAVPQAKRMAVLFLPSLRRLGYRQSAESEIRAALVNTGAELLAFEAEGPDEYPATFAAMQVAGAQSLLITGNPTFNRDMTLLADLALEQHLPAMCEWAENARSGCTFGYGPNRSELRRRLAHLVARIFRGIAPSELPIETPTHFELAVNLKSAKQLGLDVPMTLLVRADEVIE
jgi:putative ABC transport system substrate-binding protein